MKTILIALAAFITTTHAITVDEILDKMEANDSASSSRMEAEQIVIDASGDKRTSTFISYSMDKNDKGLVEYLTPSRIQGMKILMLNDGDDIWSFSPRTNRVRKLASHQKKQSVNGSDFSYEDMSAKDIRKDYAGALGRDEQINKRECYTIFLKARSKDKTYSKIITWVDKENFMMLKGIYYDEDGKEWKHMIIGDIEKINGYWTSKTIEMRNIQKGSKTIMKINKIEFDVQLKKDMFTERNLKR